MEVKITTMMVDRPDGTKIRVQTCLNGKYKLWQRKDGRIGWALMRWPDNGIGLRTHGARWSYEEAVADCVANKKLWEEVEAQ